MQYISGGAYQLTHAQELTSPQSISVLKPEIGLEKRLLSVQLIKMSHGHVTYLYGETATDRGSIVNNSEI
jgi:hypothetical protein